MMIFKRYLLVSANFQRKRQNEISAQLSQRAQIAAHGTQKAKRIHEIMSISNTTQYKDECVCAAVQRFQDGVVMHWLASRYQQLVVALRNVTTFALIGLVSACTLTPTYERPVAPVADNYGYGMRAETDHEPMAWRSFYSDPQLQTLIQLALENNRDLRIATLNIEQAQAQYQLSRADRLPTLNASGGLNRAHTPASISPSGSEFTSSQYTAGLGVTAFELDLFGRVKSASNAAIAQYLASQAAQKAVRISLIAEVAKAYSNLQGLDAQRSYAKKIREGYQRTLDLTQQRFRQGVVSQVDVSLAQSALAQAQGDEEALARNYEQAQHALTLLVGRTVPQDLLKPAAFSEQGLLTTVPIGLPAIQLAKRPDVMEAEFKLQAAYADIGAARAAFFPRILLTGNYGSASNELAGLFRSGSLAWGFVPQLTLPIFDWGRNLSNLDLAQVRKNIHIAQYEKTIQVAFREVADALAAQITLAQQITALQTQAKAQAKYAQLTNLRLQSGLSSALEQLDSQRRSDLAEQALLQLRMTYLASRADLYKVLGGGVQD